MKTFIGIDVSFASSLVCMLDEHGQVIKRGQIVSEPEAFIAFLRDLPWPVEAIGLEAGPLSQSRMLQSRTSNITLSSTARWRCGPRFRHSETGSSRKPAKAKDLSRLRRISGSA